jgi:hypothetical protein
MPSSAPRPTGATPSGSCFARLHSILWITVLATLIGIVGFLLCVIPITGVPCPLCGMTTSVEAAVRLDVRSAFDANPAGIALVVLALIVLAIRPRRVVVPSVVLPVVLASMWAFELHRFGLA